jgi:hypothetical protein
VYTGIGAALAAFSAFMFKRLKRPTTSVESLQRQVLAWSEETNAKLDTTNELLSTLTNSVEKLVDIAARQEVLTTKIWEQMLRGEAKE